MESYQFPEIRTFCSWHIKDTFLNGNLVFTFRNKEKVQRLLPYLLFPSCLRLRIVYMQKWCILGMVCFDSLWLKHSVIHLSKNRRGWWQGGGGGGSGAHCIFTRPLVPDSMPHAEGKTWKPDPKTSILVGRRQKTQVRSAKQFCNTALWSKYNDKDVLSNTVAISISYDWIRYLIYGTCLI